MSLALVLPLLVSCGSADPRPTPEAEPADTEPPDTDPPVPTDADADGWSEEEDCDDHDAAVHPGAEETCDGTDDDCDGAIDEQAADAGTWFADADGDGFGDPASEVRSCDAPAGTVVTSGDCDDSNPAVSPAAAEVCNGIDDDCDPGTSEDGRVVLEGVELDAIQAALDAAEEGAVVEVCAGTYEERLVLTRSVTLRSVSGAEVTTVDAAGLGPAVEVEGGAVRIEGLTITGGSGSAGGGIVARSAAALEVVDCVLSGNMAEDGGALFVAAAAPTALEGGAVRGNEATGTGGMALVESGGSLTLRGVAVESNSAVSYGGAILAEAGSAVVIEDSAFSGNQSLDKGGVIYATSAAVTAVRSSFEGNAGSWGGVAFLYGSTFDGTEVSVVGNSAEMGGAFYVYMGTALALRDAEVRGNFSTAGGGARVKSSSTLTSDNSDWGEAEDENSPDDVALSPGGAYWFGAGASFVCSNDAGTCE